MLSAFVFLGVTLASMSGVYFVTRLLQRERTAIHRRIAREFNELAPTTAAALYKNAGSMSLSPDDEARLTTENEPFARKSRFRSIWQRTDFWLKEAKVAISPELFLLVALAIGSCFGFIGYLLAGWLVALAAWLIGFAIPLTSVHLKRNALREKLLHQLPNAFDLMARVLRSGQSMPQALQSVTDAFDDPIRDEFAHCQQQQQFGLRPETIFREMAQRSGVMELQIFAMAMIVHRQIGGNISEVLERLAEMVRARLQLRQQILSLTAEGRMQGWTLVVLPFIMMVAMYFVNRQYLQVLFEHKELLAATAASMTFGILWIRNIVNFEE